MKVASFETLEFLLSPKRKNYHVISMSGSPCHELTNANYPSDQILIPKIHAKKLKNQEFDFSIWIDEKKQIKHTNVHHLIRKLKLRAFVPDTYSSLFLEKWAHENKLQVISTPHGLQKKFENKIFFDKFLHKHKLPVPKSWILKSEKDLENIEDFPVIIQTPNSNGSLGTFLMKSKKEIQQLMSSQKKVKFPLLCRQFIDKGIPLGVSILIGPHKMVFSAIRMQAYFSQKNGKSIYYGIQWMKTSSFSPNIINKMNAVLTKAGKEMQNLGFRGIAAFDFVLQGDDLYFIECNPRTGGSTPQMSFQTELIHGLVFTDEFIRISTGKDLSKHRPFIPNSNYEGFNLDCGFMVYYTPHETVINALRSGVFKFEKNQLQHISVDVEEFITKKETLFLYYVREEGTRLSSISFLGFLMTHFPLLEIKKGRYTFTQNSEKLLQHLEDIIIKK